MVTQMSIWHEHSNRNTQKQMNNRTTKQKWNTLQKILQCQANAESWNLNFISFICQRKLCEALLPVNNKRTKRSVHQPCILWDSFSTNNTPNTGVTQLSTQTTTRILRWESTALRRGCLSAGAKTTNILIANITWTSILNTYNKSLQDISKKYCHRPEIQSD